jgi:putative membrane protein
MDIVTIYFALLPLLLLISIRYAIKGNYTLHYKSQLAIYVFTLVMVVIFEIGVRFSGGFIAYAREAGTDFSFLLGLLIVHILIAVISVVGWSLLLYRTLVVYKTQGVTPSFSASHKRFAKIIVMGLSITSYLGVLIYYLLFID